MDKSDIFDENFQNLKNSKFLQFFPQLICNRTRNRQNEIKVCGNSELASNVYVNVCMFLSVFV